MKKRVTVSTYKLFALAVILFLIVAITRLGIVALASQVDGMNIDAFAKSRNTVSKTLYADRGVIYDVNGEILAQTVNSYTVIAFLEESRTESEDNIRHVINKEETAKALAPILEMTEERILELLLRDKYQVELKQNITELTRSKIEELNLDGIGFSESSTRYYQSGTFASYIVGYAKPNSEGIITGELGIESFYNDELKGIDGETTYEKDLYGYKIPNSPEHTIDPISGSDVYLTIDSSIQLILENAINDISKLSHEWAIMTVMDANTGAIVGSATSPSFNPNDLNTIDSYLNPLVSYQYEPGSTMKTFSFAAAIEEGIYNGSDTFKSGSIDVADVTISDYNDIGWGDISYDTGYAYSSNVATTLLALDLGTPTLTDYYYSLGFGTKTGIELSGELAGEINFYYQSELANAAFGQGIAVTPIQLLQAYTTITNNGVMIKPYIVDKVVDYNGNVVYEGSRTEIEKVYSKDTMDYMQNLMYDVVYNGTTKYYQTDNVTIIGKTGTAQIASPNGGYLTGDNEVIRSFMSVFPKEEPKYILYVATSKYVGGNVNLAAATTNAIEEIASYAKITDVVVDHKVKETIYLENYISANTNETVKNLESINLKPIVIGTGNYIINQYPYKDLTVFEGDKIFLKTNSTSFTMPDLTGYSASDLKTVTSFLNLTYQATGYGYVSTQSIPVGTILTEDSLLEVELQ